MIYENELEVHGIAGPLAIIAGAIPMPGFALVSSILTKHITEQKFEKVNDSLIMLADKIKCNEIEIKSFLNEEQAAELFERALREISLSSNKDKIKYLQNFFVNALTEADQNFEQKEYFFNLLSGLTVMEMNLLKLIYIEDDSFIETVYPYVGPFPTHTPIRSETYVEGRIAFKEYLKNKFDDQTWGLIKGAVVSLQGKGLASIEDNLVRSTTKQVKVIYNNIASAGLTVDAADANRIAVTAQKHETPIESSVTELGKEFFDFIKSQ